MGHIPLGNRQAVRHEILILIFAGSNPASPVSLFLDRLYLRPCRWSAHGLQNHAFQVRFLTDVLYLAHWDTGTSEKSEWKALAESMPRVDENFVWRLINSSAAFRIQEENAYLIEKGRAILKSLRK